MGLQIDSLGTELNASQDNFKIALKATIQQAANIGRIAYEVRETIRSLPTKLELAKIQGVNHKQISSEKPSFSAWVKTYTDLHKDTLYRMMSLYEALKDSPNFEPPPDMSWSKCLMLLTQRELTEEQIQDTADEIVEAKATEIIETLESKQKNLTGIISSLRS